MPFLSHYAVLLTIPPSLAFHSPFHLGIIVIAQIHIMSLTYIVFNVLSFYSVPFLQNF
jgi:hypothetical protein